MDDNDNKCKTLNEILFMINPLYDLSKEKRNVAKHITCIYDCFKAIYNEELEAHKSTSRRYVSQSRICKITGLSRQTINNHKILQDLISCMSQLFNKIDDSHKLSLCKTKIKELERKIKLYQERDAKILELEEECKNLRNTIKTKDEQYNFLVTRLKNVA